MKPAHATKRILQSDLKQYRKALARRKLLERSVRQADAELGTIRVRIAKRLGKTPIRIIAEAVSIGKDSKGKLKVSALGLKSVKWVGRSRGTALPSILPLSESDLAPYTREVLQGGCILETTFSDDLGGPLPEMESLVTDDDRLPYGVLSIRCIRGECFGECKLYSWNGPNGESTYRCECKELIV